ncbi:MAG: DUF481 domain-containing protein [Planctomycetota bacterium]
MKTVFRIVLSLLAASTAAIRAQDRVTLSNGDVVSGTLKAMADGKLVVSSPLLGDISVDIGKISDIQTESIVDLRTITGERLRRRIAGVEDGRLKLAGEGIDIPPLPISEIDAMNPPAETPARWTGSLTVGGSLSTGNTDRRAVGAGFDASRRTSSDRLTADASWDYAQDRATGTWTLTQRRVGAGLKYDYFLSRKSYALVTTRVLGDTLADIALRFTAGAGLGEQWVETDAFDFFTEVGVSYFNTNYRSATPTEDYLAARVAYKLNWELAGDTRLIHGVEAYPSLEQGKDLYMTADTRIQTALTSNMIAQLQWVWDWDNTPSPGFDRSDHRFLVSVGWTF